MTVNERVKDVRKSHGLTMEKFGERIGLKKAAVSVIESGKCSVTDANIKSICREFNVNEQWLRTGEGEPYIKLRTDDIIAKATVLLGKRDPLFESIVETYSKLDDVDKEVAMKILTELVDTYRSKKKE